MNKADCKTEKENPSGPSGHLHLTGAELRKNERITFRKVRFKSLRVGDRFISYPYSTHNTHALKIRNKYGSQWADPLCDAPLRKIGPEEWVRVMVDKSVWAQYPKLLLVVALALAAMGVAWLVVRHF